MKKQSNRHYIPPGEIGTIDAGIDVEGMDIFGKDARIPGFTGDNVNFLTLDSAEQLIDNLYRNTRIRRELIPIEEIVLNEKEGTLYIALDSIFPQPKRARIELKNLVKKLDSENVNFTIMPNLSKLKEKLNSYITIYSPDYELNAFIH